MVILKITTSNAPPRFFPRGARHRRLLSVHDGSLSQARSSSFINSPREEDVYRERPRFKWDSENGRDKEVSKGEVQRRIKTALSLCKN